ncbi:MFS transporter [Alistipes senegalensis]|uniref:MFS transporter n=1 Tax=Alistipes senegalensis JC50 TaxID=1033732 RepID=A0ABY5V7I2_9BACT|nr:MFS transporter [Alistipes senegalensis]UEA86885.1 MFS transporter [Alistipes senegalensis]UWN65525.1 MFS transporter [Alistipes senegalensis JC50]
MNKEISLRKILPVMFGFFIMGFVDIVGVSTSYVKNDFAGMNDTMVNLISLSCFLWFFLLSIPTGMLMNRIGRKKTVLLSFALHVAAMIVPLAAYDFTAVLIAFALIGIGNTLLQVSLNPLVTNVIAGDKLTGTLTLGQFVKAVSSFLGPIIAAAVTGSFLGWKMIFPIYAAISLLALVWLWLTPIAEQKVASADISIGHTFSLLKDKYIVAFFIGILVLVGVDVGMGITFPKLLMERCILPLTDAGMGNSVYFFARTVGAFLGGILLMKLPERKFFTASVFVALAGLAGMIFLHGLWSILACVAVFGIGYANLFSIIFSISMQRVPERANEVSALLIVGVAGGAVIPPVLGVITDAFGSQGAAIIALSVVWLYLVFLIGAINAHSKKA